MCQLEKLQANERREPLVFTLCKLELRRKAIVLQSRFSAMVNKGQNVKKKTNFHKTKTNLGASAAAWFQGGSCFGQ